MKKFQLLTLGALLVSGAAYAALDWSNVENIAANASVVLSSNDTDANRVALTDNNDGTSWQANAAAEGADWVLIDLGENKDFRDIEIKWENSHPLAYNVYVTETAPLYTAVETENTIDAAWLDDNASAATSRTLEGEAGVDDHIVGDFSGRYILIYSTEDNNFAKQYGMRIFEVRAGDFSSIADKISRLSLTDANVIINQTVAVTVKALTATGEADLSRVSGLTLTASDPSVAIVDKGNGIYDVTPASCGDFTLTASATADGAELTATCRLSVSPDPATYISNPNMTAVSDARNADGADCAAKAIDGNDNSSWEVARGGFGEEEKPGEHLHWLLVDLFYSYNIDYITLKWEGASSNRYDIYAAASEDELKTITLDSEPTYSISFAPGINGRTDRFSGKELKGIRYLLMVSRENGTEYGLNLFELRAYGKTEQEPVASSIEIASEGSPITNSPITISTTVRDQFDNIWPDQEGVTLSVKDGDASLSGNVLTANSRGLVTVEAVKGDISAELTIDIVADMNEKITLTKAVTDSDAKNADNAENSANVLDGNRETRWLAGREGYGIAEGMESAGAHEHWLKLSLWRPFNIGMLSLDWEGANSNDYEVYVLDTDEVPATFEGMTPVLTHYNDPEQQPRTDNLTGRLDNVRTLLFRFKNNATIYGLCLYDIALYGVPSETSAAKEVTLETSVGNAVMLNEEGVTLTVAARDQYDDPMTVPVSIDGEAIAYDPADGSLKTRSEGTVTITAGEGDVAKSITVGTFNGDHRANLARIGSAKATSGTSEEPADVVLGNNPSTTTEDMYQPGNKNMSPYTLMVDLGKEYPADVIEVVWETAHGSDFDIAAGTDANTLSSSYVVENRQLRGTDNVKDRMLLDKNTPVRYIRLNVAGHAHPEYPSAVRRINLYNPETAQTTTGLNTIEMTPADASLTIYNLRGEIVDSRNLQPGTIYIIGGEKRVMK